MSVKDVFDVNGGPASQIYGQTGQLNQAYEPVVDDDDRNSLRLTARNPVQVSWNTNGGRI